MPYYACVFVSEEVIDAVIKKIHHHKCGVHAAGGIDD